MSSPESVAAIEQYSLAWLGQHKNNIKNILLSPLALRAQTPQEFEGMVITLTQYLSVLNTAVPAANWLSSQGAPNFLNQLNTEMQSRQWDVKLWCKKRDIAISAMANSVAMQQTRNAQFTRYIDIISGSCFACGTPGVIAGGGLCAQCAQRQRLGYLP